ncbi:unnamed protein product [Prorocentrum cordatum]|uniref:Uncharacterized protein n=1 Tax=Prorocentrum cordatum TaxID=2364126 RepID=A0ABN9VNS9_9DINO|nr:unnamed protein product [Polarella glacialis]
MASIRVSGAARAGVATDPFRALWAASAASSSDASDLDSACWKSDKTSGLPAYTTVPGQEFPAWLYPGAWAAPEAVPGASPGEAQHLWLFHAIPGCPAVTGGACSCPLGPSVPQIACTGAFVALGFLIFGRKCPYPPPAEVSLPWESSGGASVPRGRPAPDAAAPRGRRAPPLGSGVCGRRLAALALAAAGAALVLAVGFPAVGAREAAVALAEAAPAREPAGLGPAAARGGSPAAVLREAVDELWDLLRTTPYQLALGLAVFVFGLVMVFDGDAALLWIVLLAVCVLCGVIGMYRVDRVWHTSSHGEPWGSCAPSSASR